MMDKKDKNIYQKNEANKDKSGKSIDPNVFKKVKKQKKEIVKKSDHSRIKQKSFKKPHERRKAAKKSYKIAKEDFKLVKKTNRKKLNSSNAKLRYKAKKEILQKKAIKNKHKKEYKQAKKKDITRLSYQAKSQAKLSAKTKVQQVFQQDDVIDEAINTHYKIQRTKQGIHTTFRLGKNTKKIVGKTLKKGYGVANRSYNWSRGRGFQRTPKNLTSRSKLQRKLQVFKNRRKMAKQAKKAERGINLIRQVISGKKTITQAMFSMLNSPSILFFLVVLMICSVFSITAASSTKPAIVQEDKDLTEAWEYMTKIDAEKSDDSNHFYTALDDVMFYMNFKFEDYQVNEKRTALQTYKQYLEHIWTDLNGKAPNYELKTMKQLMQKKNSAYYLGKEESEEYNEMVNKLGYSTLGGQLNFPYATDNLLITRRYGYERSDKKISLFGNIEVSTTEGLSIISPLNGTIEALPSKSSIQLIDAQKNRVTLEGVSTARVHVGTVVHEKQPLGSTLGSKLTIHYEKYNDRTKKWEQVNPAFYFPKVTYAQVTYLNSDDFDPGKTVFDRARKVYNYLSKLNYTKEGICAALGCFAIESSINPKRAEGDYLNPPVGASKNSWDDPNWLAMGGMDIYGKYPNILHRGLGLGQWTDTSDGSTRHTLLLNFAKTKKKKWYGLELQLDFILNGDVPASRIIFKNVASSKVGKSIPELTTYFLSYWEGNPGDKLQQRIQSAQNWYNYFSNPANCAGYKVPITPVKITSEFGYRDFGGQQEFHRGLDFAASQGTPIHAIGDGTVVKAGYHYSWGNYVQIRHEDGTSSLYAHQSELKVKAGDKVKQGDVIGQAGSTGNSTGPHLHLEYSISTDMSQKNLRDPAEILGLK